MRETREEGEGEGTYQSRQNLKAICSSGFGCDSDCVEGAGEAIVFSVVGFWEMLFSQNQVAFL